MKIKIVLLIFFLLFIISLINVIKWFVDNININKELDYINENITINKDDININFNSLININKNTVGFIIVKGTNIKYPILKTNNNYYYLNHDFHNNYNKAGWIFLDYRNNLDYLSSNTIIYGHQRKDGSMFNNLNNLYSRVWQDNANNHYIIIVTINNTYLFKIFSFYHERPDNKYLKTNYDNNFINNIVEKSLYNFHTSVNKKDYILTLSTCYGNKERTIVHAKLIEKSFNN